MAKRRITKRKSNVYEAPKECYFCKAKTNPDFLDAETLKKFVSERGKIHSRLRSGICSKHQRKLTTAVKRARLLALLPFVVRAE
jgi:small subunit ribosomal protein S18